MIMDRDSFVIPNKKTTSELLAFLNIHNLSHKFIIFKLAGFVSYFLHRTHFGDSAAAPSL